MARLSRTWFPDVAEHLIVRGNDRQPIFHSDGDRVFFHRCAVELSRLLGIGVHAYVLMTNHVHLLATAAAPGAVSSFFQRLGRRYVPYFNRLHGRTGTLWEGRFRSCPVEGGRYLMACHRYIERNPLRAGIAAGAAEYPWSSHGHYGKGRPDDLVTPHAVYLSLGVDDAARRAAYLQWLHAGENPETVEAIRRCTNRGRAFGSEAFRAGLEAHAGRLTAPRPRGRPVRTLLTRAIRT